MITRKRNSLVSRSRDSVKGTILLPCLFLLSLISLLVLGVQNIGGVSNTVSVALIEKNQASMAAHSGIEIAYGRLVEDWDYAGEQCAPFSDSSSSIDITVTPLGDYEYEVLSGGSHKEAESMVKTRAAVRSWCPDYPLTVGGDLNWQGLSKLMGDCHVNGTIDGTSESFILGDLYLPGDRDVQYDVNGDPISIDGHSIPLIGGEVTVNEPVVEFPTMIFDSLREMAIDQGQFYSGSQAFHFNDMDFEGVVYFEGHNSKVQFRDVTINGILVCDAIQWARIMPHEIFKIRCDDSICPNVAILAPGTRFDVQPDGGVDIYGLTLVDELRLKGDVTFTGPVICESDFRVWTPHSNIFIQYPPSMNNFMSGLLIWADNTIIELEYEEL